MSIKIHTISDLVKGEMYNTCHYRKSWGIRLYSEPCTAWQETYSRKVEDCGKLEGSDHFVFLDVNKRISSIKILSSGGAVGWTTRLYPAFVREAEITEYDHYISAEEECEVIKSSDLIPFMSEMKVKILKKKRSIFTVETITGAICEVHKTGIQQLP